MRPVLAFVALCVLAADAYGAEDRIAEAERLITRELRYAAGIELIERALLEPDLTERTRVDAYRLLGIAYVARGKTESAEVAFDALLAVDPGYRLDRRISPKIRDVFERARAKVAPRIVDVTALPEGRRVVVSARIEDPRAVLTAVDLYARAGGESFERHRMTRTDERVEAVVDVPDLSRLRVDYFVVGRHDEEALARVADESSPLSVVVERPAPAPTPAPEPKVYATWWFWTAAGVVIAGAVVGALVVFERDAASPPGTLPPLRL